MQTRKQAKIVAHLLINRKESCRGSMEDVVMIHLLLLRQREGKEHNHVTQIPQAFHIHINPRENKIIYRRITNTRKNILWTNDTFYIVSTSSAWLLGVHEGYCFMSASHVFIPASGSLRILIKLNGTQVQWYEPGILALRRLRWEGPELGSKTLPPN